MMHFCDPPVYAGTVLQPYIDLGQGSFRLWAADGAWKWIQRDGATSFDWSRTDAIVNGVLARGVREIVYAIGGATPVWAAGGLDTLPQSREFNGFPPVLEQYWVNFVAALATRYRGRISAYEIWNEWDLAGSYRGTPEQMIRWSQLAYQTIRNIDPTARVISPTITGVNSKLDAYSSFFLQGGGAFCDVIGVHGYPSANEPEALIGFFERVRGIAASSGQGNKPLWNTEFGVNYWRDRTGIRRNLLMTGDEMPDDRAGAYVVRLMMAAWLGGAERAFFYDLGSPDVEAVSLTYWPREPTRVTPAGLAYKYLARLLTNGALFNYREQNDVRIVEFASVADGLPRRGKVYWRKDFQAGVLNFDRPTQIFDVLGQQLDLPTRSAIVNDSPIFCFDS